MEYQEALDYIHHTLKFGSHPGLDCIRRLLERMGNPQDSLRFVHVAGTNGKGSTSAAIASVLTKAGYKTGLYISPYIEDFCERIQINGRPIQHAELARCVEEIRSFAESVAAEPGGRHPTEFEIITALAFHYYVQESCDVVVLEVGLGGRFDATNVIGAPLASVITSISYDHTEILGNTLSQIAYEKSGIIKKGGLAVSSPAQDPDALAVMMEACASSDNTLTVPGLEGVRVLTEGIDGTEILYGGRRLFIPLCGRHQIANFLTAYETLRALRERRGFVIPEEAVAEGFAAVRFPARMEVLQRSPLVILDGAHNPGGAATLADSIDRYLPGRKITMILGILADKDYRTVIPLLARRAGRLLAVRPDSPRALDPAVTMEVARSVCPDVMAFESYDEALADALRELGADGVLVIVGSLYLAGPMRRKVRGYFHNRQN